MTGARCPHCNAPTVIRDDHVTFAHLTWCPRVWTPRPEPTLPEPITVTPEQALEQAQAHFDQIAPKVEHAERIRTIQVRNAMNHIRNRLRELGTTHAEVRRWAIAEGLTDQERGMASRELIEAYAAARAIDW